MVPIEFNSLSNNKKTKEQRTCSMNVAINSNEKSKYNVKVNYN